MGERSKSDSRRFVLVQCPTCGYSRRVETELWNSSDIECDECGHYRMHRQARHQKKGEKKSERKRAVVKRCRKCLSVLLAVDRPDGICHKCARVVKGVAVLS